MIATSISPPSGPPPGRARTPAPPGRRRGRPAPPPRPAHGTNTIRHASGLHVGDRLVHGLRQLHRVVAVAAAGRSCSVIAMGTPPVAVPGSLGTGPGAVISG